MCKQFPFIAACIVLISATVVFNVFTARALWQSKEFNFIPILVIEEIVFLFTLLNFFQAAFTDPGVLQREKAEDDQNDFHTPLFKAVIIRNVSVRLKYCDSCNFYRPPRTSHCSMCNNCVENFDHHCPWINNCIGRRNYRFFFTFLLALSIHILMVLALSLYQIATQDPPWKEIPSMVIACVCVLTIFPIMGLLFFHIALLKMGLTTNEQVTHKFPSNTNPYTNGFWHNFSVIFCRSKPLRYVGYKSLCKQPARLKFLSSAGKDYQLQQDDTSSAYSINVENTNV